MASLPVCCSPPWRSWGPKINADESALWLSEIIPAPLEFRYVDERRLGLAALADAERRIQLAHRFYNEAVSDTRALRLRPAVRLFHLGGTAKLPEYFDYMLAE